MVRVAYTGPGFSQGRLLLIVLTTLAGALLLSAYKEEKMNTRKVYHMLASSPPLTVGEIANKTELTKEQVRSALSSLKRRGGHVARVDKEIEFSKHISRSGERQKWKIKSK